jgi:hypothetical protein
MGANLRAEAAVWRTSLVAAMIVFFPSPTGTAEDDGVRSIDDGVSKFTSARPGSGWGVGSGLGLLLNS